MFLIDWISDRIASNTQTVDVWTIRGNIKIDLSINIFWVITDKLAGLGGFTQFGPSVPPVVSVETDISFYFKL